MMNWLKTGMIVIVQILFFVSVFAMSAFSEDLLIELEYGLDALEEYKSYQLPDGYDYIILDENIINIDSNNLITAIDFGNTWIDVYENGEKIYSYEVVVYFVQSEPVPWSKVSFQLPYLTGYPDQTIRIDKDISYGELVTMLSRMLNLDIKDYSVTKHWSDPYRHAIDDIMLLPYFKDKTPESSVTKAEMAYVVYQYADYVEHSLIQDMVEIKDVDAMHPFYNMIQAVANENIMWLQNDYFYPNFKIKRGEVISILNYINGINSLDSTNWVENRFVDLSIDSEYYLIIISATAPE